MKKCQSCSKAVDYRQTRCWECYKSDLKSNIKSYPKCKHCDYNKIYKKKIENYI